MRLITCIATIGLFMVAVTIAVAQDNNSQQITSANVDHLTPVYSFEGVCAAISPDETLIATTTGLYDLQTGETRIDRADNPIEYADGVSFSPNGHFLTVTTGREGSLYDVATGEQIIHIPYSGVFMAFSDRGQFAYIHGLLYDTETWETLDFDIVPDFERFNNGRSVWRRFTSGNGIQTYLSEGGNYWVHPTEGIYNIRTGELLQLPDEMDTYALENGIFSPNDAMFFTGGDGIEEYVAYRLPSFERAYELEFDIGHMGIYDVVFSPNNLYFALANDGIYQTFTGQRLFEIVGTAAFSNDSVWVVTGDGRYQLPTGRLVQEHSENSHAMAFSENDELVAVYPDGVFDLFVGGKRFDVAQNALGMRFSADSSLLYVWTSTPELLIYDVQTGEVVQSIEGIDPVFSPEERFLALTNASNECQIYAINAQ